LAKRDYSAFGKRWYFAIAMYQKLASCVRGEDSLYKSGLRKQ
jgi:hypothetical protein